jgi:hypothetical protein
LLWCWAWSRFSTEQATAQRAKGFETVNVDFDKEPDKQPEKETSAEPKT